MSPGNFKFFLPRLISYGVQFVLIGGGAGIAHGLARATYDVDIVYARADDNLDRIVAALDGINLYYRGAPPGLPFQFDRSMLRAGLNFTLTSSEGDIDLLGEVAGGGTWENLQSSIETIRFCDQDINIVTLPRLIQLKRAAGRPKDFETIAELEILLQEQKS